LKAFFPWWKLQDWNQSMLWVGRGRIQISG